MNLHFSTTLLERFRTEDDGQTLVEYGLLIGLLALVAITALTLYGRRVSNMWGVNGQKYPDPPAN